MATNFSRSALFAAFAAMTFAVPSFATPVADGEHAVVSFRDLDLSTDTGAAALHDRVSRAAARVCGAVDQRDLTAVRQAQMCRQVAMASAEPQVQVALGNAQNGRQYALNGVAVAPGL